MSSRAPQDNDQRQPADWSGISHVVKDFNEKARSITFTYTPAQSEDDEAAKSINRRKFLENVKNLFASKAQVLHGDKHDKKSISIINEIEARARADLIQYLTLKLQSREDALKSIEQIVDKLKDALHNEAVKAATSTSSADDIIVDQIAQQIAQNITSTLSLDFERSDEAQEPDASEIAYGNVPAEVQNSSAQRISAKNEAPPAEAIAAPQRKPAEAIALSVERIVAKQNAVSSSVKILKAVQSMTDYVVKMVQNIQTGKASVQKKSKAATGMQSSLELKSRSEYKAQLRALPRYYRMHPLVTYGGFHLLGALDAVQMMIMIQNVDAMVRIPKDVDIANANAVDSFVENLEAVQSTLKNTDKLADKYIASQSFIGKLKNLMIDKSLTSLIKRAAVRFGLIFVPMFKDIACYILARFSSTIDLDRAIVIFQRGMDILGRAMKVVLSGLKRAFQATVKSIMKGIRGTLRLIWRIASGFVKFIGKAVWYSAKGIWSGIKWSWRAITNSRLALWIKAKRAASAARWARWMQALKSTRLVRWTTSIGRAVGMIFTKTAAGISSIYAKVSQFAQRVSAGWTKMKDAVKAFPGKVWSKFTEKALQFSRRVKNFIMPKHGIIRNSLARILKSWRWFKNLKLIGPVVRWAAKAFKVVVPFFKAVKATPGMISTASKIVMRFIPKIFIASIGSILAPLAAVLAPIIGAVAVIWLLYDICCLASYIWPGTVIGSIAPMIDAVVGSHLNDIYEAARQLHKRGKLIGSMELALAFLNLLNIGFNPFENLQILVKNQRKIDNRMIDSIRKKVLAEFEALTYDQKTARLQKIAEQNIKRIKDLGELYREMYKKNQELLDSWSVYLNHSDLDMGGVFSTLFNYNKQLTVLAAQIGVKNWRDIADGFITHEDIIEDINSVKPTVVQHVVVEDAGHLQKAEVDEEALNRDAEKRKKLVDAWKNSIEDLKTDFQQQCGQVNIQFDQISELLHERPDEVNSDWSGDLGVLQMSSQ